MPINQNIAASDYTTYLKHRATVVQKKWGPETPEGVLNSQLRASRMSQIYTPTLTALLRPAVHGLPAQTRSQYTAHSKITWTWS